MRVHPSHKIVVIVLLLVMFCIPFAAHKQLLTAGVATGINIPELAGSTVTAILGGYAVPAPQEETVAPADQTTSDWSLNAGQTIIGSQAQAKLAVPAAKNSRP